MRNILLLVLVLLVSACATKRYGRLQGLSEVEQERYSCEDIEIELAKVDQFNKEVKEGTKFNSESMLGFLGDLGIGNRIEKKKAVKSAADRQQELEELATAKSCNIS